MAAEDALFGGGGGASLETFMILGGALHGHPSTKFFTLTGHNHN